MLEIVTRNWELKILSVAIACALWMFVMSSDKSRVALPATVEFVGLPADMMVISAPGERVDLEVEAMRWAAVRLTSSDVRVRVNLGDLQEGESIVQLTPELASVPPGVTVTRITPTRLRLALSRAVTGTVRVIPQLRGMPPPGHVVRRIEVNPSTVEVRGPRPVVATHGTVDTLPVDVSNQRESFTRTVGLSLPEATAALHHQTVTVAVDIKGEDEMAPATKGRMR
jgi:YbbR domain-containing protein